MREGEFIPGQKSRIVGFLDISPGLVEDKHFVLRLKFSEPGFVCADQPITILGNPVGNASIEYFGFTVSAPEDLSVNSVSISIILLEPSINVNPGNDTSPTISYACYGRN